MAAPSLIPDDDIVAGLDAATGHEVTGVARRCRSFVWWVKWTKMS
jgi:hypothetical protein